MKIYFASAPKWNNSLCLATSLTSTAKHKKKLSAAKASSSILKSMYWKLNSFNISQTNAPGDTTSQDITASRINRMQRKMTAGKQTPHKS